jgi:hypothetical protein
MSYNLSRRVNFFWLLLQQQVDLKCWQVSALGAFGVSTSTQTLKPDSFIFSSDVVVDKAEFCRKFSWQSCLGENKNIK